MGREGVPGVVEVPPPKTGSLQVRVPGPSTEVRNVDVSPAGVREDELAPACDHSLLLEGPPHRRQDIDLASGAPGLQTGTLALPPALSDEDLVPLPINRLPLERDLLRGPKTRA